MTSKSLRWFVGAGILGVAAIMSILLWRHDPPPQTLSAPQPQEARSSQKPSARSTSPRTTLEPSQADAPPNPEEPLPQPEPEPEAVPRPDPDLERRDREAIEEAGPFLTGTLLGSSGAPESRVHALARVFFPEQDLWFSGWDGGREDHRIQTDEQGRFRFRIDHVYEPGTARKLLFRVLRSAEGSPDRDFQRGAQGLADLSTAIPDTGLDLGEIVVSHQNLLAAGWVRNEDGNPVRGVTVEIAGYFKGRSRPRTYPELEAETGSDGYFAICGTDQESSSFRIQAKHSQYAPTIRDSVLVGTSDLDLVLRLGGRLRGRLLLDPGIPTDRFLVRARTEDRTRHKLPVSPDGSFLCEGISAGPVDVNVWCLGEKVATVESVPLQWNASSDSDLEIDLRNRYRLLRLRALDEEDRPLSEALLNLIPLEINDRSTLQHTLDTEGRGEVLVPSGPRFFRAWSYGRRAVEFEARDGEQTLRLTPGFLVELECSGDLPDRAPPFSLHVELTPISLSGEPHHLLETSTPLGEDNRAQLQLNTPGLYRFSLHLFQESGASSIGSQIPQTGGEARQIEVRDREGTQRFILEIPADAAEVIRELMASR